MLDQGNREVGIVTYRIRVAGTVGPATRAAFRDLRVQTGSGSTQLSGELDQIALHRVLERIESLGLELLDVVPSDGAPPANPDGRRE